MLASLPSLFGHSHYAVHPPNSDILLHAPQVAFVHISTHVEGLVAGSEDPVFRREPILGRQGVPGLRDGGGTDFVFRAVSIAVHLLNQSQPLRDLVRQRH